MKRLITAVLVIASTWLAAPAVAADETFNTYAAINYGASAAKEWPDCTEIWLSASLATDAPRIIARTWVLQARQPGGTWTSIRKWEDVARERRQLHVPCLDRSYLDLRVKIQGRFHNDDWYRAALSDVAELVY